MTIFYTDDDQDDLDFFKEIISLINTNFSVITYTNGQQLIDALNNPPPCPHLVFLDINMPGMNGLEALKHVRQLNKYEKLPVIIFSTSNDEDTIAKSQELGANYYLPKTGAYDRLKKAIEHALTINWGDFTPNKDAFVYNYTL